MCPLALFAEGTNGDDEDDDNDDDDDDDDVIIGHRFLPGSFLGLLVLHKLFPLFLWQGHISIILDPDPYEIAIAFFSVVFQWKTRFYVPHHLRRYYMYGKLAYQEVLQGDCDGDNDCIGDLVCGTDNCAQVLHIST